MYFVVGLNSRQPGRSKEHIRQTGSRVICSKAIGKHTSMSYLIWLPRETNNTNFYHLEIYHLDQWFPTAEEFHEFRGGISTFYLSYLFVVQ